MEQQKNHNPEILRRYAQIWVEQGQEAASEQLPGVEEHLGECQDCQIIVADILAELEKREETKE